MQNLRKHQISRDKIQGKEGDGGCRRQDAGVKKQGARFRAPCF
jgi:hypothetical protein